MKLTYRGKDYDYNPPLLEVTESDIACQYRGQSAHYSYVRHVPIPQQAEQLTYRGAVYQSTRRGQVMPVQGAAKATERLSAKLSRLRDRLMGTSPAARARRDLLQESSQLHHENIVRSLQHRLEVAKAEGNDLLVQQLESEMSQSL